MKVLVEAYGCALNRGEAEELVDRLVGDGHELVWEEREAETVVVFTCCVIDTTERKMLRRIGHFADWGRSLFVCGCMANVLQDNVRELAPNSTIIPVSLHSEVLNMIGTPEGRIRERALPVDAAVGILPISTGCLGSCAYCITKRARGDLKSRPIDDVVDRAKSLLAKGAVELQVCAQDTASYGKDAGFDLAVLIESITALKGDFMLRIGMMNPDGALRQIPSILHSYGNEKVFKFLHLPVQSGSDGVLGRMERRYRVADFLKVVEAYRSCFPDGSLATDVIVGFPGETDEDFDSSVDLIKEVRPDIVNVTRFSARPGTPAATMKGQIVSRVAKDRSRAMTDLRFSISGENNYAWVGKSLKALATERRVAGTTFLRSNDYRPVVVKEEVGLGSWYDVEVTGYSDTHLLARVIE